MTTCSVQETIANPIPASGLTLQNYEQREQDSVDNLPNRIVEMVNPVVFASEGYPLRVRKETSLWRYLDVNHETRFERDFVGLHEGGFTAQEFTWVKRAATTICEFANEKFGRKFTARSSLSRSLHVFRSINDIVGEKAMRVFEVGPGSGNLGLLFQQNGWGYAATDIMQAFYFVQSRLWHHASQGRKIELADGQSFWDGSLRHDHPVHIPWWEFYGLFDRGVPSVDIVTCNHALAEMHPNSLAFTLLVAKEMLRGDGLKLFIFEGWGFEKLHKRDAVIQQFIKNDFCLVHMDDLITVFAPKHTVISPSAAILKSGKLQPYVQVGSTMHIPNNSITDKIYRGRSCRKNDLTIKLDDVTQFYRDLLETDDIRTPEERFLSLIGKNY